MEAHKLLKSVNSLNEYIYISNDIALNYNDVKIQFNMSTILALKNVRSFEIEYFNKCEENGAAIKIFELILRLPPSKTWSLLGRELISLLQYWLDAMRKHLIFHNNHWWSFLQIIMKFMKEIRIKDSKINNILLEETAECLLDLAAHSKPDIIQRHEVLCLFNICGADSSREIRFALRKQLDGYFTKLSGHLASCGDVAIQYSILEALMRWLLPRQDKSVRLEAAGKWFPEQFSRAAVDIFLERQWLDFFQDARDFLNIHNTTGDLITSVVCKRLSVGSHVVIGNSSRVHWLDMNVTTGRLSITLEPKHLEILSGQLISCCGTLVLTESLSIEVKFCREGSEVTISVTNSQPPQIVPSLISVTVKEHHVKITISPNSDMAKVDRTLRRIFGEKYQVLFDVSANAVSSKWDDHTYMKDDHTEEEGLSLTTETKKRRHVGYMVNSKRGGALASPSTASTSSLAQLHDKLAALPRFNFEKEAISVCARPQLSNVTELSEEDRQSLNTSVSTLKLRPYGVCQKSAFSKPQIGARRNEPKCLSPSVVDENSVSCLLVATIGSADESVINDTLERFPENKGITDNLVDLLVLEAFQSKNNEVECRSNEVVETNPKVKEILKNSDVNDATDTTKGTKDRACTVISNSSHTEESNTEFVEGTQFTNINFGKRRKEKQLPLSSNAPQGFDEKAVEEFFSQHFAENRRGDLVISPTLAKKINETSSETSEEFDADDLNIEPMELVLEENNDFIEQTVPNIDEIQSSAPKEVYFDASESVVPDLDVIGCVNFILDRICLDFAQCQEVTDIEVKKADVKKSNTETRRESLKPTTVKTKATNKKTAKSVKLKYSSNKSTRVTRQNNKLQLAELSEDAYKVDQAKVISPPPIESIRSTRQRNKLELIKKSKNIHETNIQERAAPNVRDLKDTNKTVKDIEEGQGRSTPNVNDSKQDNTEVTPIARRKRKLYSPKDEKCTEKFINNEAVATDDVMSLDSGDIASDITSEFRPYEKKKQTTYYKQIEQERKNFRKKLRNRQIKSKEMELSPKSKRMNEAFDDLKKDVEENEIILADKSNIRDVAIYNFTSESDDEDFKKKTPKRKTSTMKVEETQTKKKAQPKRKRANRSKTRINLDEMSDSLVDERMREPSVAILNTSLPRQSSDSKFVAEEPMLTVEHVMEPIEEVNLQKETRKKSKTVKKQKKAVKKVLLEKAKTAALNKTADRTESPLPGLVVEATVPHDSLMNETANAKLMQKYQEIYERKSVDESERDSTRNMLETFNSSKNVINITETSDNISKDHVKRDDIPMDYVNTSKPSSITEPSSPFQKQKRKRKNPTDSEKDKAKGNKYLRSLTGNDRADTLKNKTRSLSGKGTAPSNKPSNILKERNGTEVKNNKSISKTNTTSSFTRNGEADTEVINISGAYSERSFDTVGHSPITAHGDFNLCENDLPPSKDSLKRNLEPRNLEVEDFDQPIKEFFTELNKEVTKGTYGVQKLKSSTSESSSTKASKKEEDVIVKSSINDYTDRTQIPSKLSKSILRSSDISSVDGESKKPSVANLKSPLVSVTRLSSSEINKWLPSPKFDEGTTFTKGSDNIEKSKTNTPKSKDSSISIGAVKKTAKNKATMVMKKVTVGRFTSSISPIKLFDEMEPLTRQDTDMISTDCGESQNDMLHVKLSSPVASNRNTKADDCEVISSYSKAHLKSFVSDVKVASTQTSEMVGSFGTQGMDSNPSTSSVKEWFNRIAPKMSREEEITATFKDNISGIMEKLDTTLVEIHHDTSKRLAGMFAEAQAKLQQVKQERKVLYQKTASDILSGVLRLVDEQFSELDKRSQEMDEKFMSELKEKSRNLIREDCNKKKAMVSLLKEDVHAVMDLNNKNKKPKMQ